MVKEIALVYFRPQDGEKTPFAWNNWWTWADWNYWAARRTQGEFCHVELWIPSEGVFSLTSKTGCLEKTTRKEYSTPERYKFQTLRVTDVQFTMLTHYCNKKQLQKVYFDTLGMIGLGLRLPWIHHPFKNRQICSEFVTRALKKIGFFPDVTHPKQIDPNALFHMVQSLPLEAPVTPPPLPSTHRVSRIDKF